MQFSRKETRHSQHRLSHRYQRCFSPRSSSSLSSTVTMRLEDSLADRALGYGINPRGTQLFAVQISFLGLAWISVLLRGYVRLRMLKKVSSDDYLMFASVVSGHPAHCIACQGRIKLTLRSIAHLHCLRNHRYLGHHRRNRSTQYTAYG